MNIFKILVIALFLLGCVDEYKKHHITLNDPNGIDTQFFPKDQRLKIGDKPYLLFFFGADCGVCKVQIPALNELYSEFFTKVEFIGVLGPSKGFDKDMALLDEHKVKFKTTSDKVSIDYFSKAVGGVMGVPVIYIFDSDGNIKERLIGLTPKSVLETKLKQVL